MPSLGSRLRAARGHSGLTQNELAQKIRKQPSDISRWERNEVVPETMSVIALAQALSVTTDYLLLGEDAPTAASAAAAGAPGPPTPDDLLDEEAEAQERRLHSPAPRRRSRRTGPPAAE